LPALNVKKLFKKFFVKEISLAFAICLLPMLPILRLKYSYYVDWNIVNWFIAYTGEFFKHHLSFPEVFNTYQQVGDTTSFFYSTFLSWIVAIPSAFVGTNIAYRVFAIFLMFLQFFLVKNAFSLISKQKYIGWAVSTMVTWAIFPMTTLYNRSAVVEFSSAVIMHCTLACLLTTAFHSQRRLRLLSLYCAGFLFAIAAGSHPLVGLYGSVFILLIAPGLLMVSKNRKEMLKHGVSVALLIAMSLSFLIYTNHKFNKHLDVTSTLQIGFFSENVDRLSTRFFPIAHDPRTAGSSHEQVIADHVTAPYLDAQINLALFIGVVFLLILIFKRKKRIKFNSNLGFGISSFVIFSFFLWASLSFTPWSFLPMIFRVAQYACRLVNYSNMALLMTLAGLLSFAAIQEELKSKKYKIAVIICLCFSALSLGTKLPRANLSAVYNIFPGAFLNGPKDTILDMSKGGPVDIWNYTTPSLYKHHVQTTADNVVLTPIPVLTGSNFGKTDKKTFSLAEESFIQTNVHIFPWNKLFINNQLVKDEDLYSFKEIKLSVTRFFALKLPKGEYEIKYEFMPNSLWQILRILSQLTLVVWFLGLVLLAGKELKKRAA